MFSSSSILARGKAAVAGSETEQRLTVLLYDDAVQVISTLELHQLATFTYQESQVITSSTADIRDVILDHLEKIQQHPAQYSTLTVLKSLVLTKHLLLFGSDKMIPTITQQLGIAIDQLRQNYNTVLMAQQQSGSLWMMRLKGGGVDHGGPVRDMAATIVTFLQHPTTLLVQERNRVADPTSLVPVGDRTQVGWGSEQLRYQQLQQQLQREQAMQTRSNLVKADNGFGSGYSAANGQTVVGAAHGIDEMLAQQRKVEQQFRDDKAAAEAAVAGGAASFSEYQAPDLLLQQSQPAAAVASMPSTAAIFPPPAPAVDLLDFGAPAPAAPTTATNAGDLLGGIGGSMAMMNPAFASNTSTTDPFAPSAAGVPPAAPAEDPFGFASPPPPPSNTTTEQMITTTATTADLMPVDVVPPPIVTGAGGVVDFTPPPNDPPPLPEEQPQKRAVMGGSSNTGPTTMGMGSDPFAALNGVGNSTTTSFNGLGTVPATNATSFAMNSNPSTPATAFDGLGSLASKPSPNISLSSIQVGGGTIQSAATTNTTDDSDSGFLMGGGTGTGLLQDPPLGPPPMSAPPPPPPPGGGGFQY